ncbi:DUF2157 domain-containing protein [Roseibium sp.]|uniref:DUF2157 domain-containing protein n=1 Tax=Roseibium sp. TaxID=1936156 RepID=UPI003B529ABB
MFDWAYKKRLRDDLEEWVGKGWLSPDGAAAILRDQEQEDGRSKLPMALAGIGMVCVALALFAFIAANWGLIPKTIKLVGIAVLVIGANLLAAEAAKRGRSGLSDLATGFATLVFVGGMALVGQIFHLPSDWAGGALLVCLGALAAAWLTGSITSLVVAALAAVSWQTSRMWFEASSTTDTLISIALLATVFLHPFIYPARISRFAAIALLLVTYGRWFGEIAERLPGGDDAVGAMVLAGFGGLFATMIQAGPIGDLFVKWSSYKPVKTHAHWLMLRALQDVGFMMLCALVFLAMIAAPEFDDTMHLSGALALPAILPLTAAILLCIAGLLLSFKTEKSLALFAAVGLGLIACLIPILLPNILVVSALCLAALIGFCALGTWYNNRFWMLCAYLALTAVALWLLEVTIGSLLGQSVFFLVAGVVLLGMALWLGRLLRRKPMPAPAGEVQG